MRRARVLIVDDDDDLRELLRHALECAGYEVIEASDGAMALLQIERAAPDLALVDIDLPIISGAEVLAELALRAHRGRPFPVVAMSGSGSSSESPANWFLSKPMDLDLLLAVVDDFTGRRVARPFWVTQ
jgi:DNA-binding response OmpR family regulator